MKKQLIFLYRYFTKTRRWQRWLNLKTALIALIAVLLLTLMVWTSPQTTPRSQAQAPAATATIAEASAPTPSVEPTRTRTPFPPEFYTNQKETNWITLAGTLLVLIAVIGVLVFFPKKDEP